MSDLAQQLLSSASTARVGMTRQFGTLFTPDGKPAMEIIAVGDQIRIHIYNNVRNTAGLDVWTKFYTIDIGAVPAEKLAGILAMAAAYSKTMGGSAAPPTPKLIR